MSKQGWYRWLRTGMLIAAMAQVILPGPAAAGPGDRAMYFEGRGQALIYPFWTVENTDTLFEIVNGITRINSSGASRNGRWVQVKFHIRDTASADLLDFTVCLSPGDVWTASLTQRDGVTHLISKDLSASDLGHPPTDSTLSQASRGYIEAVMIDNGLTQETGCNNSHADADFSGGSEADGTDQPLFGRVIYVAMATGLATGFNAEAIKDLDASIELSSGTLQGSTKAFQALALGHDNGSVVGALLGRWLVDPSIGADTQVVVTFPLGSQSFNLCSGESSTAFGVFSAACTTTSPLDFSLPAKAALWIRDDEERVNFSPRQVPFGNEVNVLTLSEFPTLLAVSGGGKAGWFRLMIDDNEDEVTDFVTGQLQTGGPGPTDVRLPHVLPVVGFTIISAPVQAGRISATFPFQTDRPPSLYDCATAAGFSCN
jgi:hypothetical protein